MWLSSTTHRLWRSLSRHRCLSPSPTRLCRGLSVSLDLSSKMNLSTATFTSVPWLSSTIHRLSRSLSRPRRLSPSPTRLYSPSLLISHLRWFSRRRHLSPLCRSPRRLIVSRALYRGLGVSLRPLPDCTLHLFWSLIEEDSLDGDLSPLPVALLDEIKSRGKAMYFSFYVWILDCYFYLFVVLVSPYWLCL